MPKGGTAKKKKKYGTGVVGQLAKRRAERQAKGKWTLGEKLTKAGRTRASLRKTKRKITKAMKPGGIQKAQAKLAKKKKRAAAVSKVKSAVQEVTQAGRRKKIGASKGTKVRTKATGVQKTKGGEYVKYQKGSKSAGKFKAAFKSGCAGGAKSFTWDGRSYSCKKK